LLYFQKMIFNPITVSELETRERFESRRRYPFNDKRLYKQWEKLSQCILEHNSGIINRISKSQKDSAGFYRFLRNQSVNLLELINMNCNVKEENIKDRHILCIGDTSSYNLNSHIGRIHDSERIGVLENNKTRGFYAHVSLLLDAQTTDVLGLADILMWCREKKTTAKRETHPEFEKRESYKWVEGVNNSRKKLESASQVTYLFDSDADDIKLIENLLLKGDGFVIRSQTNRLITWKNETKEEECHGKMDERLAQSYVLGTYDIALPKLNFYSSTKGKVVSRKARTAKIELRSCQVKIQPNKVNKVKQGQEVWILQAKEVGPDLPEGESKIDWVLLTSHSCQTFEKSKKVIEFYKNRWVIEQLFRTTKTKGFNIEAIELESFDAILRQTVMTLMSAAKVLQLVYSRGRYDAQDINEVFDEGEQKIMEKINSEYEGKTEKQKNPYPKNKTSWATWIIARLGGWKGYKSQRPPGPLTLKRGLEKFYNFMEVASILNSS